MFRSNMRTVCKILPLLVITILCSQTSFAGFAGHNSKGDFGIQSGNQPPPGVYVVAPMYYRYDADSLKNSNGDSIQIDPAGRGSLEVNAYVLGLIWVSDFKLLGGNYSFQISRCTVDILSGAVYEC
ncbi:MAG: hypothetical protein ACYSWP_12115 [Planctomycetota bacterium]|jgi:hypothetical protein